MILSLFLLLSSTKAATSCVGPHLPWGASPSRAMKVVGWWRWWHRGVVWLEVRVIETGELQQEAHPLADGTTHGCDGRGARRPWLQWQRPLPERHHALTHVGLVHLLKVSHGTECSSQTYLNRLCKLYTLLYHFYMYWLLLQRADMFASLVKNSEKAREKGRL